ncbi:MAG: helix-turn-helix domain-containing protein [Candidatus Omnitrophica bacterium]|nr:helix-turn-helix domain-containing protein [Candidatus Omnitrophota bacterium]
MKNMPINELLKEKRGKEGISAEKIFHDIHIPSKFIEMMEKGGWESFPSLLHMKGFLRIYGDYLKIPKEAVEEGIKKIMQEKNAPSDAKGDCPSAATGKKNPLKKEHSFKIDKSMYLLLLLAALLIILYFLILYLLPE